VSALDEIDERMPEVRELIELRWAAKRLGPRRMAKMRALLRADYEASVGAGGRGVPLRLSDHEADQKQKGCQERQQLD